MVYGCQREGYKTVSIFAIRFKGEVIGIFNLYFRDQRIVTRSERHMLEALGRHLGVAIENQRLISRIREMAVSEERNLLAQELHDSIAQSLAFLNIEAQMLADALKRADTDEARSLELNHTALEVAKRLLRSGGSFLIKSFVSVELRNFSAELEKQFGSVQRTRPDASRKGSSEIYFFAKDYQPKPQG